MSRPNATLFILAEKFANTCYELNLASSEEFAGRRELAVDSIFCGGPITPYGAAHEGLLLMLTAPYALGLRDDFARRVLDTIWDCNESVKYCVDYQIERDWEDAELENEQRAGVSFRVFHSLAR